MIAESRSCLARLLATSAISCGCLFVSGVAPSGAAELLSGAAMLPSAARPFPDAVATPSAESEASANAASNANPVHVPETDDRLRRSDSHFENGRQLYFRGDLPSAHREFDAAIDALLNGPASTPDHRRIEKHLEELCDLIYRFDVEKLGAGQTVDTENAFDRAPIDEVSHMTFPVDPSIAAKLQSELHETVSGIPLDLSDPVLSFVHFFSTDRGRAILQSGLRRSGKYRPMIQRVFAEEGVPEELIYLAQAESGFLPRAVSNKQAVGMWQFIAGTGSTYDLVRTQALDERFDPEKATHAAARYLRDLHARYGDWYLAMAAYNCGAGAVDRAVERTGYSDYWELLKRHALPKETSSYVPIIVAMTIMAKNPQDYGLDQIELDAPLEYDSIQLTATTNLNLIADVTLQPLSVIRDLNPALLKMVVPSGFQIHVPKGSAETSVAALEKVPAENRSAWRLHHVETGDTLESIAKIYHVTPDRIASVNNAQSAVDQGAVLLIPASYHEPEPWRRAVSKSTRGRLSLAGSPRSRKTGSALRGTRIAASHHVTSGMGHKSPGRATLVR